MDSGRLYKKKSHIQACLLWEIILNISHYFMKIVGGLNDIFFISLQSCVL